MHRLLLIAYVVFVAFPTLTYGQWKQMNGPAGSTIRTFLSNGSSLFVATHEAGLFRSTDGGAIWKSSNVGLPNGNAAYVCRSGGSLFLASDNGSLYRSTDNGDSWHWRSETPSYQAVIGMDTISSDLLLLTQFNMFRSSDEGLSWKLISSELSNYFDATSFGVAGTTLYATFNCSLYASVDGGNVWSIADRTATCDPNRFTTDGQTLLVSTTVNILKASNVADRWEGLRETSYYLPSDAAAVHGRYAYYGSKFAGVVRSTDSGNTWLYEEAAASPPPMPNVSAMHVHDESVFAGTIGRGIFRSDDHGVSWTSSDIGVATASTNRILKSNSNLIAGTAEGLFLSSDQGETWVRRGGDSLIVDIVELLQTSTALLGYSATVVHSTIPHSNLFKSTDDGETWTFIRFPSERNVLSLCKWGDTIVALSGERTWFKSTDDGETWDSLGADLPLETRKFILTDSVYYAITNDGLWVSSDRGSRWVRRGYSIGGSTMFDLVLLDSILVVASDVGVYRSADYGRTWKSGKGRGVRQILVLDSVLLVATDRGVLISKDVGSTWEYFSEGFSFDAFSAYVPTSSLIAVDEELLVGTIGNGIWKRALADTKPGIPVIPRDTVVLDKPVISPNPFSGSADISFFLEQSGRTTIKIFNTQGVVADTVIDTFLERGPHTATWSAQFASPGIFYVQLQNADGITTVPLLLLR